MSRITEAAKARAEAGALREALVEALGVLQFVGSYADKRDRAGDPLPAMLTNAVQNGTDNALQALGL